VTSTSLPSGAVVSDIVVIPFVADPNSRTGEEAAGSTPVQLLPDMQLRRLSRSEVEQYVVACQPRDLHFRAYEDDSHRYAFVRSPVNPPISRLHAFDYDGDRNDVMHSALALSRYVALNAHCTEVAVRRIEGVFDTTPLQIKSVDPAYRFYAWRPLDGSRGFMTQKEAEALGPLLERYLADEPRLPPRVRTAIWYCEQSFRQQYVDVATAHVVTALEALAKVDLWKASLQFRTRVPILAREVELAGVTQRTARLFYKRRSHTVHGQRIKVTTASAATRDLGLMQRLLTRVLRRAIEDRAFRASFTGPKIKQRWPVSGT
jgi:hypothetical protein